MTLGCERELEDLEKTHAVTGQMCNLQTDPGCYEAAAVLTVPLEGLNQPLHMVLRNHRALDIAMPLGKLFQPLPHKVSGIWWLILKSPTVSIHPSNSPQLLYSSPSNPASLPSNVWNGLYVLYTNTRTNSIQLLPSHQCTLNHQQSDGSVVMVQGYNV